MPEGSATATGAAIGLWLYFGWILLSSERGRRLPLVAGYGLICTAALGTGLLLPWLIDGGGASSLAAIAGGALALVALVHPWRREHRWMVDHLVPGGVAALSVARLGCLFDGCDFGRVTQRAPSMVHEAGTRAWEVHVSEYGLAMDSAHSLEVHPFALYLAIWGFIAASLGEWLRWRGADEGVPAAVTAALFFVGGGAIEWLREPATVFQIVDGWSVYPLLYWAVGLVAVGLWWSWRSRSRS